MKDFKYYCLLGISLIIFVFAYFFLQEIPNDRENGKNPYEPDENDSYFAQFQNIDLVHNKYSGNISKDEYVKAMQIAVGKVYILNRLYDNNERVYNSNKSIFMKWFGIDNYDDYSKLYNKVKGISDDIAMYYTIDPITITTINEGITFDVTIERWSGEKDIFAVTIYNEKKGDNTIIKLLPRLEA